MYGIAENVFQSKADASRCATDAARQIDEQRVGGIDRDVLC